MVEALQQNNVVHSEWGGESGMSAGERESGAVDRGKREMELEREWKKEDESGS